MKKQEKGKKKITLVEQSEEDHKTKAEYLFRLLNESYRKIYLFDKSILGHLFKVLESVYAFVTFRSGSTSQYRQLIEVATRHKEKYKLSFKLESEKKSRVELFKQVMTYFWRHPYSSLRLLSWYRVKRLFTALFKQEDTSLSQWVDARFPVDSECYERPEVISDADIQSVKTLHFLKCDSPLVSIVIPVYNNYKTTLSCLLSLKNNTDLTNLEVIIADDASNDETKNIESVVENIVVSRQESNVGFVENCNRAAELAKGKYLVLLNNDTNVQKGWLDSLCATYAEHDNVGLVGPMFLFENGSLQEAGGIVWKDASAWNYGRNGDPKDPTYHYVRQADYLSGACILIELDLWRKIGGFDTRFKPAYYEDTDLAFTVRDMGYKTLYQPKSKVVHFEGVSNGTDVGSGMKKYQSVNKEVFYKKWKPRLDTQHFPNGTHVFDAKDRISAEAKTTVLFIDHYVPFWDKDAGSRSTFLYIEEMLRLGIVVKFLGANFFPHQPYTTQLQSMGVEVIYGEEYAKNWKSWIKENSRFIDVIYLHRPHITEVFLGYISSLPDKPKLIYFGHDLHFLRTEREAELKQDEALFKQAKDWKERELNICAKVDEVFYPSDVEVSLIKKMLPNVVVSQIPLYMIDTVEAVRPSTQKENNFIFVGGFGHPPNIDGITWFIDQVLPLIVRKVSDVTLHLVGSEVPASILNLDNKHIQVHGYLDEESLLSLYGEQKISIVPLRFGAGVKGKVIEALGLSLPIVSTSIGAEGIPESDSVLHIGDSPEELARLVEELLVDESKREATISGYGRYIEKYFSRNSVSRVIGDHFLPVVDDSIPKVTRSRCTPHF